jgi:hypothetical protein
MQGRSSNSSKSHFTKSFPPVAEAQNLGSKLSVCTAYYNFTFYSVLFKYEKTTSAVYSVENCIDTLLELLQMYREKPGDKVADKSGSIFTKTCCLLAILLKTTNQASVSINQLPFLEVIMSMHLVLFL